MFEISTQICQEYAKIGDSGYMEEFYHEYFFIILFYLFNFKYLFLI
jgi:hypothetical protein